MSTLAILYALGTVIGIASGQILFKLAAERGELLAILFSTAFWAAVVLYGLVTVLWVLLLREVALSRAYPIMAATYVLVPIASVLFLGESLQPTYFIGVALIIAGIVLAVQA